MRISDWSSDVCSSDLAHVRTPVVPAMAVTVVAPTRCEVPEVRAIPGAIEGVGLHIGACLPVGLAIGDREPVEALRLRQFGGSIEQVTLDGLPRRQAVAGETHTIAFGLNTLFRKAARHRTPGLDGDVWLVRRGRGARAKHRERKNGDRYAARSFRHSHRPIRPALDFSAGHKIGRANV